MDSETEAGIARLSEWIGDSDRIVFLGGAGVSTESGIPDFRGEGGIYSRISDVPPEEVLSHGYLLNHTREFYEFMREACDYRGVEPNITHVRLAQLESEGRLSAVITQNIDGLHQRAGSRNVLELHGNSSRFRCCACGRRYGRDRIDLFPDSVPTCECGGVVRPEVVLYGERLDEDVLQRSIEAIEDADMLIVGGTSLVVYPAAGLVDYYRRNRLVLINDRPTSYDSRADLLIRARLGEVFSRV